MSIEVEHLSVTINQLEGIFKKRLICPSPKIHLRRSLLQVVPENQLY